MAEQSFGRWKVTETLGASVPKKAVVKIQADDVALAMTAEDGKILGTWPVGRLRFDPYGRHNGCLDLAGQAAWITSVDERPASELAAFLRERWTPQPPPSPDASGDGPTIARSYAARTPAEASRAFTEEAERLAARGYRPALQFWADPDRSAGTAIRVGGVLVALVSLLFLPVPIITILLLAVAAFLFVLGGSSAGDGTLTVTYERAVDPAVEVQTPAPGAAAELPDDVTVETRSRLLGLAQLRDDGLITPDEYAAKRAGVLAEL